MTRRLGASTALGLALGLVPASADAAVPETKAAAQALFDQGRALVRAGNFAEACPKLAESLRLDPGIGTMLWLADCYQNTGRTATAWALFREAAALAAQEHDTRERVARRRASELEPRLTRLVIVIPYGAMLPGLEVHRDGGRVTAAELDVPIPVDPGIHALSATAPGHERWQTTFEIAARPEAIAITVPVLRPAVRASEATSMSELPEAGPRASESRDPVWRTVGLALAGAGVAAAGVGAVLGLTAKATYDESNAGGRCIDDRCDVIGREKRSSAFDLATASTVAFTAGAAAIVSGTVVWFAAPRQHRTHSTSVAPAVGPGRAGVVVAHTF
jgi:hypothetical protein